MKILVVSAEVWRGDTSGGNVLSNIFRGLDAEFAQIYCNPGTPDNNICKHYYQITDSMVIHHFLSHRPVGKKFDMDSDVSDASDRSASIAQPNKKFYSFFHAHRFEILLTAKNIIWNTSNWKHEGLKRFILDFAPDIIFAPCYANRFMLRLTRYVQQLTGKNVISYISDDAYTLKQFSLSPLYWVERFVVRYELRKTFPCYSLVYTMTEIQKKQCEHDFGANMKILLKCVSIQDVPEKTSVHFPIRFVYAGGIYLKRWKTLALLADAIRQINQNGVKIILDIYTGNDVSQKVNKLLNDGINCFIHQSVSQSELKKIYSHSDVALHVESFDLKNRLAVRMSFSTKIVDCLASGCAVMAICDDKQGGFRYLKDHNAAICVSDKAAISDALNKMVADKETILYYAQRAKICSAEYHNPEMNDQMIKRDFELYEDMSNERSIRLCQYRSHC